MDPQFGFVRIYRVDVHTMKPTLWKQIDFADRVGLSDMRTRVGPGGDYGCNWARSSEDIYLVEGLR
jgi:hypothetical protein